MGPEEIAGVLDEAGAEWSEVADYEARGTHVDAAMPAGRLREAVEALRSRRFLIEDVTAVDADPLMMVYHFVLPDGGCRVTLRVLADRNAPRVPSIQDLYPGANWHERETHDFFGVEFENHPDLSPLLLPEDAGDLNPLRKEDKRLKTLGDVVPRFAPPAETEGGATAETSPEGEGAS